MIEKEIWGVIPRELFEQKLQEFTSNYGAPKKERRMALRFGFVNKMEINNRLQIRNGKAKLTQKTGGFDMQNRQEMELDIPDEPTEILRYYLYLKNMIKFLDDSMFYLLRFENYFFQLPDYEIKLTIQTGQTGPIYSFEIELKKETNDLVDFARSLGLEPDLSEKNSEWWLEWNKKVNVNIKDWSEEKVLEVIKEYCD